MVGGMSELGTEMKCVESYNPVTQEWCQLSPMLTNRAYIALAALDGCLYALGGWNEDGGALSTVEKYSIEEVCIMQRWHTDSFCLLLVYHTEVAH